METVLEVTGLSAGLVRGSSVQPILTDVNLQLGTGQTLGIVGESGSGKSMTGLAVMGLLPKGIRVTGGSIRFRGRELVDLAEPDYCAIRGRDIAMVFQDSLTALNPTRTVGRQIAEPAEQHWGMSRAAALSRATELLGLVGVPRPAERLDAYPHELSGGLRQRVMIAMALVCEPSLLIADEPTTALDVTIQAQILELLDELRSQLGMAMLLITHDMGVVAGHTERVGVMYGGSVVEEAGTARMFRQTRHPYTAALLGSIPRLDQDRSVELNSIPGAPPELGDHSTGCSFADRCVRAQQQCRQQTPVLDRSATDHAFACWNPVPEGPSAGAGPVPIELSVRSSAASRVGSPASAEPAEPAGAAGPAAAPVIELRDLRKEYPLGRRLLPGRPVRTVKAVAGVSFQVRAGETFGLVGESGCGKSTLGRMVVALEDASAGAVLLTGSDLARMSRAELRRRRQDLQLMFQDSFDSLDPHLTVAESLAEPLEIQQVGSKAERADRVGELLDEIGLPRSAASRYPHELSGGQRQRVGLARALALNPRVIVADEPVSALDVSIRSQILNLMRRTQREHGTTYIVISHDLTVVRYIADRIGVMYLGVLVETGASDEVYAAPAHPYTAGLIAAIPVPDPQAARAGGRDLVRGELPSPIDPPSGCRFRTRCPLAQDRCAEVEPELRSFGGSHLAACHFPLIEPVG